MLLIYSILCVLLINYYIYVKIIRKHPKYDHLDEQFPCPPKFPLVGHVPLLFQSIENILKTMLQFSQEYDSPIVGWICNFPILVSYDVESIKLIANKVLHKGEWFHSLTMPLFSSGIISQISVKRWREHRRCFAPIFGNHMAKHYFSTVEFVNNGILMKKLDRFAKTEKPVNIEKVLLKVSVIRGYILLFGSRKLDKKAIKFITDTRIRIWKSVAIRFITAWRQISILNDIYEYVTGVTYISRKSNAIISKFIQEKKGNISSGTNNEMEEASHLAINCLLNLERNNILNETDVAMNIANFWEASFSTTNFALYCTLLMLAIHTDYQERILEEIYQVLGPNAKLKDKSQLDDLVFMKQCINETLRLFPPTPFVVRSTTEDFTLNDGRVIPKGMNIILAIILLHRNKRIYENPEVWDPNRFSPEMEKKRDAGSFVPFSFGPRNCIGTNLAYMIIQSQIVAVLSKYKFETSVKLKDIRLEFNTMLHITSHCPISLIPRSINHH